jgi:hypothetical protein
MVTAAVQLPERLRFLPLFLALWVLSYLAPHLLAAVADLFLQFALIAGSPTAPDIAYWVLWVGLLPVAYAWAQWLLMRRCLSTALPWALAVFVGTLLARLGTALIGDIDPRLLFDSPLLLPVLMALADLFGASLAVTALTALPSGLCFGVATSVPQALVLPASKLRRAFWIAVMFPTEYASTMLGEGLYRAFQPSMSDLISDGAFWSRVIALNFVPRTCAWLLTAVVSGLLMHAVLRRSSGRVGDQLYARFD